MQFNLKVGLFGIGLEAYWKQFKGLEEKLKSYINTVDEKFKNYQYEVINLGLIDNPEKAIIAGHELRKAAPGKELFKLSKIAIQPFVTY